MANRNKASVGMKDSTCSKCLIQAHSVPGTHHRRCPGQPDQPLRGRGENLPSESRGRWE